MHSRGGSCAISAILLLVVIRIVWSDIMVRGPEFPTSCDDLCPLPTSDPEVQVLSTAASNVSQGNILNSPKDLYFTGGKEWCPGRSFPEIDVHFRLPACKNITLRRDIEFTIDRKGQLAMKSGKYSYATTDYVLFANGTRANLCFPLSPQLLQCGLRRLNPRLYIYNATQLALVNCRTGYATHIRDFYTSPDSNDTLHCNVPIAANRNLRCNLIEYKASEYEFFDNDTSIRILPSNNVIYRPEYERLNGTDGNIRVCIPMSPEMTRCKLWTVQPHEYYIGEDRRVHSPTQNRVYDVTDYIITGSNVAVCSQTSKKDPDGFDMYKLLSIIQVVSAVFLCLAFIIHLLIPSLNYHAKPLLCHMFSMVVMYTCLAARKLSSNPIQTSECYTLFVFTYLAGMTSFFWLNVLAFDLWSLFANLQTTSRYKCGCRWVKKHSFLYYCLYAYGIPILMVMLVVLLDTQGSIQSALNLNPGVSIMCWFNNRKSAFVLFYVPLFVLLAMNMLLFVLTVFNLRHASRGAEIVNKKLNKQLLFVCFKIFVIMGLCWITEAITFVAKVDAPEMLISDILNGIQGVFLFIIYICKPATYKLLRKKLMPSPSEGTWTTDLNSSKGHERKTSTSGVSMKSVVGQENSVNGQRFCISCLRFLSCEFLMKVIMDPDSEVDSPGLGSSKKQSPIHNQKQVITTAV